MSWERYGCQKDCTDFPDGCINADLFSTMAEAMVAKVCVCVCVCVCARVYVCVCVCMCVCVCVRG
jgi:hypothetical protein